MICVNIKNYLSIILTFLCELFLCPLAPLKLYGEGAYAISDVKEVKATKAFLGLDAQTKRCQTKESNEDCSSRIYIKMIKKQCQCIPFNLLNIATKVRSDSYILNITKNSLHLESRKTLHWKRSKLHWNNCAWHQQLSASMWRSFCICTKVSNNWRPWGWISSHFCWGLQKIQKIFWTNKRWAFKIKQLLYLQFYICFLFQILQ